ncbi:hypothetical protein D3C71_1875460 [compost metagenome]
MAVLLYVPLLTTLGRITTAMSTDAPALSEAIVQVNVRDALVAPPVGAGQTAPAPGVTETKPPPG